jgi:ABC-2 type transport system permease protein
MPVFELGYRHWEGKRTSAAFRWMAISRMGISLAFRSKILRRLAFFAWTPLLYFGPFFYLVGTATESKTLAALRSGPPEMMRGILGRELAARVYEDPESLRPLVWSVAFQSFMSIPQALIMIILVAIAGAPLIAQDVGSKAFLVYFSKPISKWEYLLGKAGTVLFFILLVTLFPGLVLYLISIAVSPSARAIGDTWTILPRLFGCAAVIAIPSTCVILFLSSLAREARYVAFAWIALWALGEASYLILHTLPRLRDAGWITLLSPWECLNAVAGAMFDAAGQFDALGIKVKGGLRQALFTTRAAGAPLAWLAFVSLACFCGLARRVSAPMRI